MTIVHHLAGCRSVADIFFPDWFANKIMPVSAGVYVVGAALVARRLYRDRKSGKGESSYYRHQDMMCLTK